MTGRRLQVIGGLWIVLILSLWASDSRPAVLVLGAVVAFVATGAYGMLDLGRTVVGIRWPRRRERSSSPLEDDQRLSRVRRDANAAVWADSTEIHDTLVELVDDRLLVNHSIDRGAAPEAAAAVLSPTLLHLVAGPHRRAAGVRELQLILTDIEAL